MGSEHGKAFAPRLEGRVINGNKHVCQYLEGCQLCMYMCVIVYDYIGYTWDINGMCMEYTWDVFFTGLFSDDKKKVVNHQNQHQGYQPATVKILILWLFGIATLNNQRVNDV